MNALIGYVILAFVIVLVLWIIYWFIRTAIRFPKETLAVTLPIVICIALFIRNIEIQSNRSYVPEVFQVKKIVYRSEELWGFGPGENETGIIVYELPDAIVNQIILEGLGYLDSLAPQGDASDWHGRYEKWFETPVVFNQEWSSPDSNDDDSEGFVPRIKTYLLRYGFPIPLNTNVEDMVDKAIQQKGNYYAYGRIGLIIVIPKLHRVVYAYHG